MSTIAVEVIYALFDKQRIFTAEVEQGASVLKAILASGITTTYPEIDLNKNKVGIYSEMVTLDTPVKDGDRIEIYRSLQIDPKSARRLRAERAKK